MYTVKNTSLVAQMVAACKVGERICLQCDRSLGQEYPLEKEMATYSSVLA